jgi:hypothetical protein
MIVSDGSVGGNWVRGTQDLSVVKIFTASCDYY